MTKKKFNLEKALAGHKLVTRDGRDVCCFAKSTNDIKANVYPYEAHINGEKLSFTKEGTWCKTFESNLDLFLIGEEKTNVKKILFSEYSFSKKVFVDGSPVTIFLTVYLNYEKHTYDIIQDNEEGIFPRNNNTNAEVNRAYFELALEALDFIEKKLFNRKKYNHEKD